MNRIVKLIVNRDGLNGNEMILTEWEEMQKDVES